jgi:hypothetical protein
MGVYFENDEEAADRFEEFVNSDMCHVTPESLLETIRTQKGLEHIVEGLVVRYPVTVKGEPVKSSSMHYWLQAASCWADRMNRREVEHE